MLRLLLWNHILKKLKRHLSSMKLEDRGKSYCTVRRQRKVQRKSKFNSIMMPPRWKQSLKISQVRKYRVGKSRLTVVHIKNKIK